MVVSDPGDREAKLWRIIQRGAAEKAPGLIVNFSQPPQSVEQTLLPLLENQLPHLSKKEVYFRHNAIIGGLSGLVSGPIGSAMPGPTNTEESKEFMLSWIEGSLRGAASNTR